MNNMYEFRFQAVRVPVLANGDVRSLSDAAEVRAATGVDGVMCARGMLENPAMFAGGNDSSEDAMPLSPRFHIMTRFAGFDSTPAECVSRWLRIALDTGTPFTCFHHHLGLGPIHGILNVHRLISIAS